MPKRRINHADHAASANGNPSRKVGQRGKYPQELKDRWVELAREGKYISQIGEACEIPKPEWQNIRNYLKAQGVEVARERGERASSLPPKPKPPAPVGSTLATLIANADPVELQAELNSLIEQRQRLDRAIKAIEMLLNG